MAHFYANENMPLPVVEALRVVGHDVLTSLDAGNAGQAIPDEDVLAFAVKTRRAIWTLNRRHFIRLHQQSPAHFGIVVSTMDAGFARMAASISKVVDDLPSLEGMLVRVNLPA